MLPKPYHLLYLLLTGCSLSWLGLSDEEPVQTEEHSDTKQEPASAPNAQAQKPAAPATQPMTKTPSPRIMSPASDTSLSTAARLSQLWARVDQLEHELQRQQEDYHVLKKGLMTGLIPEHWQDQLPKYSPKTLPPKNKPQGMKAHSLSMILGEGDERGLAKHKKLTLQQRKAYEQKLAAANQHFRSGDYGKAILAYQEIGKDYPDNLTKGSHLLWIGASWFRLKEYNSARKNLMKLMKSYADSNWAPEAEFLLAKADYHEGFIEKSLNQLRHIAKKYNGESVGERAKSELRRIEESL